MSTVGDIVDIDYGLQPHFVARCDAALCPRCTLPETLQQKCWQRGRTLDARKVNTSVYQNASPRLASSCSFRFLQSLGCGLLWSARAPGNGANSVFANGQSYNCFPIARRIHMNNILFADSRRLKELVSLVVLTDHCKSSNRVMNYAAWSGRNCGRRICCTFVRARDMRDLTVPISVFVILAISS